ncbi:MAG: NAD-dependent epimerase/dehydratase family protein, partial [Ignavibacteria bacterium]|nr:NAD-dependent epimerase/dehydratase family protein [Ignavibacteria bacterium]
MKERLVSVVTGGTGFVGSHLADLLIAKGHKVKVIARNTSSMKWLEGKDIEVADCGLFDKEKLIQVVKDADYVFHVAGVVKAKEWEDYLKGNVETTKNVLDAVS